MAGHSEAFFGQRRREDEMKSGKLLLDEPLVFGQSYENLLQIPRLSFVVFSVDIYRLRSDDQQTTSTVI